MKIHVIPAEGFQVKDHTGRIIPEEGITEVDRSPVVEARLREGLLIEVDPGEITKEPPSETSGGSKSPDDRVDSGDPEPEEDEVDDRVDLDSMTKAQIAELLRSQGIDFETSSTKAQLIQLALAELGDDDVDDDSTEDED